MAKEKCITRSFPTAVVKLKDGSEREFPCMKKDVAEVICNSLDLEVESVTIQEYVYELPQSVFLKYATRR